MRIWVTCIGAVSALGPSAPRTMDRLLAGDRGFGPVTAFDPSGCRSAVAAQIPDEFIAGARRDVDDPVPLSRTDAMAIVAAREALEDAGLSGGADPLDLVVGGSTAGMLETEALLAELARRPERRRPDPRMRLHPLSATADRMRAQVAPFRRARTICSACSSGANALLLGACWIQTGRSSTVLAGGADGLCLLTFAGFGALGVLSPEPCRPFDIDRQGLSLGEGAAFVVLESEATARQRGAHPLAELRGWALGAEAHHITNPEASGRTAARIMKEALERGGIAPAEIDYINAHGTATRLNDTMETRALTECFGPELSRVPVSSSKGQLGHTLGAAGALEAAVAVMTLTRGVLPPTKGLERVDPACGLEHVREARPASVRSALSSSFGFGGMDTVLVLTQPEGFPALPTPAPRAVYATTGASVGPLGVCDTPASLGYLDDGASSVSASARIPFEPRELLDARRARRLDRGTKLATVAAQNVLGKAALLCPPERLGAVIGSAFGAADATASYLARVYDKGARFAVPAAFPSLVPSSLAAHTAIYLGLAGPVLASFDLGASAEGAMVTAVELIEAGVGDGVVAGGAEEESGIADEVLAPLFRRRLGPRGEGAAVLLLEARPPSSTDGGRAAACVAWAAGWRGDGPLPTDLPGPDGWLRPAVVAADSVAIRELLASSPWSAVPLRAVARAGAHEAAGGFAAAGALAALVAGELDAALVLGVADDRGYALLLTCLPPCGEGS